MVVQCAVYGCNNCARGASKKLSYYRFRYRKTINVKALELASNRRKLWYQFLKRKDISFSDADLKSKRICSVHFVGGKPADWDDTSHVDWVPSLHAPTPTEKTDDEKIVNRYQKWKNSTQNEMRVLNETDANDPHQTVSAIIPPPELETEISLRQQIQKLQAENLEQFNLINTLKKENEDQLKRNEDLKKQFESCKLERNSLLLKQEAFVNQDDEKIEFFTGLPNLDMFYVVFNSIQNSLCDVQAENLDNFQKLLLSLMKLRLNCSYEDLAFRFKISQHAVIRVFQKVLIILKHSLQNLIHWPDRDCLKLSTPRSFRARFGTSVVAIIDCFEISTQRSSTTNASNQSWSDYEREYTAKYLIGVTPYGVVSFISDGYAGHSTDTYITEKCGIMNKLIPGDVVLAERGFLVENLGALQQAELETVDFENGKSQLHPKEVEHSREIAAVRSHVEGVIRCIRQKYQLLNGPVPISLLQTTFENNTLLDYAVHVACMMINLCEPVVPDE